MTFGEARDQALEWARARAADQPEDRLVLVWDPSARLRVVVKFARMTDRRAAAAIISKDLAHLLGSFFSGDVLPHGSKDHPGVDQIFDVAWGAATVIDDTADKARKLERRRSKDDWYEPASPPWPVEEGPPIVTFASYKGGFGRSTALAATAVGFAKEGLRVLVIDLDLEAPGLWSLLPPQHAGDDIPPPESGLIDVLLDPDALAASVYPAQAHPAISVLPAGAVDASYMEKLSRVDYEAVVTPGTEPDGPLLRALRELRQSGVHDLILLDARAGLHDLTGAAINGTPHLVVLFGRDTDESWAGVDLMLRCIGGDRIGSPSGQQDVILVYAKAPGERADLSDSAFSMAMDVFREHAWDRMSDSYYARAGDVADEAPDFVVPALGEPDAPHDPVGLLFDRDTLHGDGRRMPADALGYRALRDRIRDRVGLS